VIGKTDQFANYMPGMRGPEMEWLYERGAAWLAGESVSP
jgi:hypothetical protein